MLRFLTTRLLSVAPLIYISIACLAQRSTAPADIVWARTGPGSPKLIQDGALYGRMIRTSSGDLLCSYERAGKSCVKRSLDNGATWLPEVVAARSAVGIAANPELVQLSNGDILLPYNERPNDGKSPFAIRISRSSDNGKTWAPGPIVFEADSKPENGCWEPCARQLPGGDILLCFANESPYRESDEQEISVCRSHDDGVTWSAARTVAFRKGHRDGMPSLLLMAEGKILIGIEDNGPGKLQPAILSLTQDSIGKRVISGDSPERVLPIQPPLAAEVYAGAPYLCLAGGNVVLLSCQSDEVGQTRPQMAVYAGLPPYRTFTRIAPPFAASADSGGYWNSLFALNRDTVAALSSTKIDGVQGLWMTTGRLLTSGRR